MRASLARSVGLAWLWLAASAAQAAAPTQAWVEAPLPPGINTLARAAGFERLPPRWRLLEDLTRRLHAPYGEYGQRLAPSLPPGTDLARAGAPRVRVPLEAAIWSRAVFERNVPLEGLVGAIVQDRRAAWLYRGLATLDEPTLRALAGDPDSLRRIYRDGADAFAVFGRSLRVVAGCMDTPGGAASAALWEQLVGEAPTHPARFAARLMSQDGGRAAELYDTLARLDGPRQQHALARFMADPRSYFLDARGLSVKRLGHLRQLQLAASQDAAWWRDLKPFARVWPDAGAVLRLLPLDALGRWRGPAEDGGQEQDPDARAGPLAAGLLSRVLAADLEVRETRVLRLTQLQQPGPGLARAFARRPLLALALDALSLTEWDTRVGAAQHAENLEKLDGQRAERGLTQFQSLLALLLRARRSGGLEPERARTLAQALVADMTVGAAPCATAAHLARGWMARNTEPESREWRLLRALAGPQGAGPTFEWEGLGYRLDPAGAELLRLQRWRQLQGSPPLDASLDLCGTLLGTGPSALHEGRQGLQALATAAARRQEGGRVPDYSSASLLALREEADRLLTESLGDIVYAVALGWPGGSLAASAQARRHDLELGQSGLRRGPWSVPAEVRAAGRPRHVRGSLLGLELALAERALRRLGSDLPEHPPTLHQDYYLPFARAAGVLAGEVPPGAAQAVARALARGRERLAGRDALALDALAVEARLPEWRRRALAWAATAEPEELPALFGLADLARLGGLSQEPLARPWGWPALDAAGLLGPQLDLRLTPDDLLGVKPGSALVSALPDLQLRLAELVAEAGWPDALAAAVLPLATQDLLERVQVGSLDDLGALQRYASALPRERLHDYLPALVSAGWLVPVFD